MIISKEAKNGDAWIKIVKSQYRLQIKGTVPKLYNNFKTYEEAEV